MQQHCSISRVNNMNSFCFEYEDSNAFEILIKIFFKTYVHTQIQYRFVSSKKIKQYDLFKVNFKIQIHLQ